MRRSRSFLIVSVIAVLLGPAAFAQGPSYPYSTALAFTASTGTVTGYNMYRAPYASGTCGTVYTRLNATPFTATNYNDNNPPQGAYCYAATALDGTAESGFSNIDSNVQIPPPPPTGLGATVAKNANGTHDVIYAWTNPAGAVTGNTLYCGPSSYAPAVQVDFATTKVRVTTPPETTKCVVTATSATGESGASNAVKVSVP